MNLDIFDAINVHEVKTVCERERDKGEVDTMSFWRRVLEMEQVKNCTISQKHDLIFAIISQRGACGKFHPLHI